MATPARAYSVALALLSRRELSEAQVRQRLGRRGFDGDAIDDAVRQLKESGALDDARVAGAIARTATSVKRRGRARVMREIEQAGISSTVARSAVDATFSDLDEDALLDAALAKRLRGRDAADLDESARARLYRFLRAQGFEHDRVMKRLGRPRSPRV